MADFDDIIKKAKALAGMAVDASVELYKSAEEKTKVFAKTTKIKTEITLERKAQTKLFVEIGKKYYELTKNAPASDFEELFTEVSDSQSLIDEKMAELEELNASIDESEFDDDEDTGDATDDATEESANDSEN